MASFGFRNSSLRAIRSSPLRRRLAIENLERRNLLTVPVSFDAGHAFSVTGFHPDHIEVAKMNGDAFEDFVVSNYVGSNRPKPLQILLGNGDGTFRSNFSLEPPDRAVDMDLGDYNNDGKADVFLIYETIIAENDDDRRR